MADVHDAITLKQPAVDEQRREYELELESLPAFAFLPRLKGPRYLARIAATSFPLFLADLFAISLSLFIAWALVSQFLPITPYLFLARRLVLMTMLTTVVYPLFGLYPGVGLNPILEFRQSVIAASSVYGILVIAGTTLGIQLNPDLGVLQNFEIWMLVLGWMMACMLAPFCRLQMRRAVAGKKWWSQPVLIIGDGEVASAALTSIDRTRLHGLRPAGIVGDPKQHWQDDSDSQEYFLGALEELPEIAEAHRAYWAILSPKYMSKATVNLVSAVVPNVILLPESDYIPCLWNQPQEVMGRSAIHVQERLLLPLPRMLKRTLDIVLVVLVGILISPLLLLLSVLIKATSRGPIIYRQRRIGHRGKIFSMWKFRSMFQDAEQKLESDFERDQGQQEQANHKRDPHITPLGRFMRKWNLDELPQLWNILRGEMSIVGPRPVIDTQKGRSYLRDHAEGFSQYVRVLPGITGLWQVSGRASTTFEERISLDSYYVRNWSPWLDLYILLKTFRAIVVSKEVNSPDLWYVPSSATATLAPPRSPQETPRKNLRRREPPKKKKAGLKVLQIVESANAGVGRHTLDICTGLSERDCDVHLIYSPLRNDRLFTRRLDDLSDISITSYPIRREICPGDMLAVRFIRSYLRAHGPFDLVHGHSSKGGALARLATFGLGIPAVYTPNAIRTMHPNIRPSSRKIVGMIERLLAKTRGAVVAVSPEELEHLKSLNVAREMIHFIPNGVPNATLPTREEARAKLGLPFDAVIIGFVGRFSEQKNPEVLLKAFAMIAHAHPQLRLALVGWGEKEHELKEIAEQAQIADRIDWLGEQPGQLSMPAFDVFALPSRFEGMPYVLLESLVAGLPIVTTRTAGASLMVESGVNGEIIEQDQVEKFAAALKLLAHDPTLRSRYADASFKKSHEFTLDRMLSDTLQLYRSLVTSLQ